MPSLQQKRNASKKNTIKKMLKAAASAQYQAKPEKKRVALEAALAATYIILLTYE